MLTRILKLVERISMSCLDKTFRVFVYQDKKYGKRLYLQIAYECNDTNTGDKESWIGSKYYLSEHMTDDEVVKTVYKAFKQCVEHEVMEGFKVDNKVLFNPHIDFEVLLAVTDMEVKRRA